MPINVLVLDDEATWRDLITEVLQKEGYTVQPATNLAEAREWLVTRSFHLAVIDIVLEDGEEGLDLLPDIAKLNREADKLCAPVILTGYPTEERAIQALQQGAFNFLRKPRQPAERVEDALVWKRGVGGRGFSEQELLNISRMVLKRVLQERSRRYEDHQYTLYFDLAPGSKTKIELRGPAGFTGESSRVFDLDVDAFAGRGDDLQFHFAARKASEERTWHNRAKTLSADLYHALFENDPELLSCLSSARDRGRGLLHFVFRGARDMIRLPLELLPGETSYLVIENPLVRQISGVKANRVRGIDRVFLDETPEIKILLIASNTYPPIDGVDQEIALLQNRLPHLFQSRGFNCAVETIPTDDANYDNVYACLERCHYHVVHYAGHGFHDENNSDDSGLSFWEKPNRAGDVKPMPIRVLRNLLAHSDARFFYLSCCVGAKGAPESSVHLTGNDFQGILEGVVRTGIPGVLGYRWNVWDTEAKELALAFYENLVIDLSLDLALFKARRALQQNKYYNETWASPVLVTQTI